MPFSFHITKALLFSLCSLRHIHICNTFCRRRLANHIKHFLCSRLCEQIFSPRRFNDAAAATARAAAKQQCLHAAATPRITLLFCLCYYRLFSSLEGIQVFSLHFQHFTRRLPHVLYRHNTRNRVYMQSSRQAAAAALLEVAAAAITVCCCFVFMPLRFTLLTSFFSQAGH